MRVRHIKSCVMIIHILPLVQFGFDLENTKVFFAHLHLMGSHVLPFRNNFAWIRHFPRLSRRGDISYFDLFVFLYFVSIQLARKCEHPYQHSTVLKYSTFLFTTELFYIFLYKLRTQVMTTLFLRILLKQNTAQLSTVCLCTGMTSQLFSINW